ncbi:MAG: ABC transporter permease [Acidobacteria bacterium]|nr:ABC transporter permease [Acidobacteriota bacterium]
MRTLLEQIWHDVRFGARMLVNSPGFTIVAVLTLALGIGANTAMFSIIDAILLRPLSFPDPERLVQIWETDRRQGLFQQTISPHEFNDWRTNTKSFEVIAAYKFAPLTLIEEGRAEYVRASAVSASFFSVLRVQPMLGRDFLPEEDAPGRNRVAILSFAFWKQHFGSDPAVVGRQIVLNGEPHTVVGIMPREAWYPFFAEMWTPLGIDLGREPRVNHYLFAIGRIRPSVSLATAQAEMDTITRQMEKEYPDTMTGHGINLVSLQEELVGNIRLRLYVLMAAVGLVLLIGCTNVTNLLLARAAIRQREVAIRVALGGGRIRLVRQFLTESVLLFMLAGSVGILFAVWGMGLIGKSIPLSLPRAGGVSVDYRMLCFALGASLLTGILFGLAPAIQYSRPTVFEYLKQSSSTTTSSRSHQRLLGILVISEISLAFALLTGAALLGQSFFRLRGIPLGFQPRNALTMRMDLPSAKYGEMHRQADFGREVVEGTSSLPGVEAVGVVDDLPFSGSRTSNSFEIEGRPLINASELRNADVRRVTPGYFRAMGIPLLQGREFTDADQGGSLPVAIVNRMFAQRFLPEESPLGRRIRTSSQDEVRFYGRPLAWEIIGVVGDIKHDAFNAEPAPEVYFSFAQKPSRRIFLVIRTLGPPEGSIDAVRATVQSVDPEQAVFSIQTMEQRLAKVLDAPRLNAQLLGVFALVALILAAVGTYGVISYSVTQRSYEIGLRMALGAQPSQVLGLVLSWGARLTILGLILGLIAAAALTRLIQSLLFGVRPLDPVVFGVVALQVAAVALLACYLPARRAAKVDPIVTLRHE